MRAPLSALVCAAILVVVAPISSSAQSVTIAWDRNPESFVAGYVVQLGVDPSRLDWEINVGSRTSLTLPALPAPTRVYFRVIAYTYAGVRSLPSATVSAVPAGGGSSGSPMPESWRQWYGIGADGADDDGDGVTNLSEYLGGTNPVLPNQWFMGEGATGVFRMRLALANPSFDAADVRVRFLDETGPRGEQVLQVPAMGRRTLVVNDIPGLANTALSAVITSIRGGVVAERTMSWGARAGEPMGRAGHTGRPLGATARNWFFAEGAAGFFDSYFLVANPGTASASLTVEFHDDAGRVVRRNYTMAPASRLTIGASAIPELAGRSFSTQITSSVSVSAERAMYFGVQEGLWRGGHVSAGATAPATEWFVAEGATGPFFDTYLLIANTNSATSDVVVRYLTPSGLAFERRVTLAPRSRHTIWVDGEPGLADTAVSMSVTASRPVVVERSMYWSNDASGWREAHSSAGITRLGQRWALAEGESGGNQGLETYVLVANPGPASADVTVTFLRENAAPVSLLRQVPGYGRLTVSSGEAGLPSGSRFGVLVDSSRPVAVERSMYWNSRGIVWSAGTNETGFRLR
ncbi:MAG: fibronectin type III domain-containing protein [Acidobacteria bacterium]|nr:fibronectin type III domain-containing protein [Acidobacteriota bacterium]